MNQYNYWHSWDYSYCGKDKFFKDQEQSLAYLWRMGIRKEYDAIIICKDSLGMLYIHYYKKTSDPELTIMENSNGN